MSPITGQIHACAGHLRTGASALAALSVLLNEKPRGVVADIEGGVQSVTLTT